MDEIQVKSQDQIVVAGKQFLSFHSCLGPSKLEVKKTQTPELNFFLFHSVKSVPFRTVDLKTSWATWRTQMLWNTDIVNKYMKAALLPLLQLLLFFPRKMLTLIFTNKSVISNLRCTEVTLLSIWAISGHLFCRHSWINELRVKKVAIHHTR